MAVETEIKLRLPENSSALFAALWRLGYEGGPRILEIDQIYDRPDAELKLSRRLLRLRSRGDRWTVTYKGPATTGPHKSREEIEADVDDGAAFGRILASLGYVPTFRYEKQRTIFHAPGEEGIVTLDETPMGSFLELEGQGDWIDATAAQLGFSREQYITASYASLYQEHRRRNPGVPQDMTF